LFELSSQLETLDNIVAFWRPEKPMQAGCEHRFRYRMSWGMNPGPVTTLATVSESRAGRGGPAHAPIDSARRYAITFTGQDVYTPDAQAIVTGNAGTISNIVLTPIPQGNGARLTFELTPGSAQAVELRANLVRNNVAISETWLNRWTL
jgi:periplasmic glucans biosynthesis protein